MGKIRNAENGADDIIKVSHGDITSVENNVSRFVYDDVDTLLGVHMICFKCIESVGNEAEESRTIIKAK